MPVRIGNLDSSTNKTAAFELLPKLLIQLHARTPMLLRTLHARTHRHTHARILAHVQTTRAHVRMDDSAQFFRVRVSVDIEAK